MRIRLIWILFLVLTCYLTLGNLLIALSLIFFIYKMIIIITNSFAVWKCVIKWGTYIKFLKQFLKNNRHPASDNHNNQSLFFILTGIKFIGKYNMAKHPEIHKHVFHLPFYKELKIFSSLSPPLSAAPSSPNSSWDFLLRWNTLNHIWLCLFWLFLQDFSH